MRSSAPFVAAVALAATCVTGCGSGTGRSPELSSAAPVGPPSALDLSTVLSAAHHALATSSSLTFRLDATAVAGATPKPVTGSGAFDFAGGRGQAHLNQAAGLERLIFLPASVFVAQANPVSLPAGKVWISAGLTEPSSAANIPQFITQVESLNPGLLLIEVESGSQSAAPITASPGLHGYAVQVNLVKAQAHANGPSMAGVRRAIGYQLTEMSGATAPTQLTVDVGIDRQGRLVLLRSSPPGAGTGTITVSLSRFGTSVAVAQPNASQVVDISALTPSGEGDPDGS